MPTIKVKNNGVWEYISVSSSGNQDSIVDSELITVEDIDTICGENIQVASKDEVTF